MSAFEGFLFYAFGAVLLASGLGVIFLRNPVHCALLLVLSFIVAAVLWLMLGAEFLAWVLILVYVGAVMVLFLFVVMMLDLNLDRLREGFWSYLPIGLGVSLLLGGQLLAVFASGIFDLESHPLPKSARVDEDHSNAAELGEVLYTDYLLAFEAAAAILLVAIVAAIVLTMRRRSGNKQVDPADQVTVQAADRVRMEQVSVAPSPAAADEPDEPAEPKDQERSA